MFILFLPLLLFAQLIQLNNKCFIEYFDTNKKIPVLAYYTLTKEEILKHNPKRLRYFYIDKRLPKQYRISSKDYIKQKCLNEYCDRGHQVGNDLVDYDLTCQKYSFMMSNITPQTRTFNRKIYKGIEDKEKLFAKIFGKIYVIEGNCQSYGTIDNNITIPKIFYKIFITKYFIIYSIVDQKGNMYNINILKNCKTYNLIEKLIQKDLILIKK